MTHSHWDHFSLEDIKRIIKKDTTIVCPKTIEEDVKKYFDNELCLVEPNNAYSAQNIKFETFHSYNLDKPYHPKDNNWVGYTIIIDGQKITIVGDSDNTPELNQIKTDILLVPIGGEYTMNADEAAELTNNIKPKKVIPTHYGEIVGNKNLGEEFKNLINKDIICELQI